MVIKSLIQCLIDNNFIVIAYSALRITIKLSLLPKKERLYLRCLTGGLGLYFPIGRAADRKVHHSSKTRGFLVT
jgi:hypothetical protein